jgi:hypothetical protein
MNSNRELFPVIWHMTRNVTVDVVPSVSSLSSSLAGLSTRHLFCLCSSATILLGCNRIIIGRAVLCDRGNNMFGNPRFQSIRFWTGWSVLGRAGKLLTATADLGYGHGTLVPGSAMHWDCTLVNVIIVRTVAL